MVVQVTKFENSGDHFGLVLPGAVARGAYEAGVVQALAESKIRISRIVATSSGALNGLAYAVGIRSGKTQEMANRLADSWIKNGSWENSLNINLWGFIRGKGLSTNTGLLSLMRSIIEPCTSAERHPVELKIIVTPLKGVLSRIGSREATSFESIITFKDEDFDSAESLEKIFTAVSAACAFPGLFEPVNVGELGPCVDGGAVNNAPIRYALEASGVNRVIMPVPFPSVMPTVDATNRFTYLSHLVEILINERLFRDLKAAQDVNEEALALEGFVKDGTLTFETMEKIRQALHIRKVEVTEIRPETAFKTSPFAGLFHQDRRRDLLSDGYTAGLAALKAIPTNNPEGVQTT